MGEELLDWLQVEPKDAVFGGKFQNKKFAKGTVEKVSELNTSGVFCFTATLRNTTFLPRFQPNRPQQLAEHEGLR